MSCHIGTSLNMASKPHGPSWFGMSTSMPRDSLNLIIDEFCESGSFYAHNNLGAL